MSIYDHASKRRIARMVLSTEEYSAISRLAGRNNVSMSDYLRAIVIDVLDEEGIHVRPIGSQVSSLAREASQASGASTS